MDAYSDAFSNDDYSELDKLFFKSLRESRNLAADPSGWLDTYSTVERAYPLFDKKTQGYYTDILNQMDLEKKWICDLVSEWDEYPFSSENLTLCHSATVGSVIVMAFLISQGVRNVIFETPYYFATFYQAETMGMNVTRIPTYYSEGFQLSLERLDIPKRQPCAVWLTQPRTALGIDQEATHVRAIIESLSPSDFLIIDEATEQMFPSVLSSISPQKYPQVIKIRSIFKGLGVNGVRLAYIAHHNTFRPAISEEMEVFLGALDIHSIGHGVELAKDVARFKVLLSIANEQVQNLARKAEMVIRGTDCEISRISNGYIGSGIIHFNSQNSATQRTRFVEYCANHKVPVILGSAMGFANHKDMEFFRLNYFNREHNVLEGLRIISGFKG